SLSQPRFVEFCVELNFPKQNALNRSGRFLIASSCHRGFETKWSKRSSNKPPRPPRRASQSRRDRGHPPCTRAPEASSSQHGCRVSSGSSSSCHHHTSCPFRLRRASR